MAQSEATYKTLVENLPQKIFWKDRQLVYVSCNEQYARDLGIAPSEIVGKTDYDLHPTDLAEAYRADDARIMASGMAETIEEIYTAHGVEQIVQTVKNPLKDKNGNVTGILGIFWDISDRKQAEEEREKLVHGMKERVKELNCLYRLSHLVERPGISLEEILEASVHLLPGGCQYPPITCARLVIDGRAYTTQNYQDTTWKLSSDIVVAGRTIGTLDLCYLEERPPRDIGPFLNEESQLIDAMAERLGRIIERTWAEERLRASEERHQVLFESSRDALMTVVPPSWNFTSGNPAAVALYGAKDEEQLTSLGPWDVSPEFQPDGRPSAEKAKEMIETAVREGSNFFEWTHKQLDGQEFPSTVLLARVELRGETFLQATVRNITERKRAEEESRETNRLLEEQTARANEMAALAESASQAKSEFLANMSHEIRTPMTAILGFAEQLREPDITPSDRNNHVAVIERNAKHLLDLINDILDLSKIEAGKLTIELIPSGVTRVVAGVASMMHVRAAQKGLPLAVEYAGEIPETILTDPSRLRQALVNLVGNAIKFTDKGSIRIVSTFLPQWRHKQAAMQFQVIDTGIGMSREKLDKLFKPFMQADASTSRRYGGTGLGLTITRHISGLLGGELTIESSPGEGTTCTLVVPTGDLDGVKMLTNPAEAVQDEDSSVSAPSLGDKPLSDLRILLAEDGHDNQLLITTVLRKAGAEVTVAENGRIAVEKATIPDTNEFDAILMDMQMSEMDGYQATRALRNEGLNCPIIALTAHAMSGDRDKCLDAGCTDYCSKPIDRNRLIATIARHVKPDETTAEETEMPNQSDTGDAEIIRSELADDPDMADIVDDFVAHLPERLSAMTEALANNHHEELIRLAHQLKGAGGGYGYPQLTDASRELEEAANSRDTEAAKLLLGKLSALVCAVLAGREAPVHP